MRIFFTRKQFEKASYTNRARIEAEAKAAAEKQAAAEIDARVKQEENKHAEELVEEARLYNIGVSGSPADVRMAAMLDTTPDKKAPLVEGCLAAEAAGKKENLLAFLKAYVEFKRSLKERVSYLNKDNRADDGFFSNVGKPLIRVIERSPDPLKTIQDIAENLPPVYRKVVLDYSLITACTNTVRSTGAAEALLAAGADPSCENGLAVQFCVINNYVDIGVLFLAYNGDLDPLPQNPAKDYADKQAKFKEAVLNENEKRLERIKGSLNSGLSQPLKVPAPLRLKPVQKQEPGA